MPSELPKLTEHGARLLSILRGFGTWSTEAMIATKLSVDRLGSSDFMMLNVLVERGVVEVRYARGGRAHMREFRLIASDDEADTKPVNVVE